MTLVSIRIRTDNSADWAADNPILAPGEWGFDSTLRQVKIGNGAQAWLDLPFATFSEAQMATILTLLDNFPELDDTRMTMVDADASSDFRVQQDARLPATIDARVMGTDPFGDEVSTWDEDEGRPVAGQGVMGQQIILRQSFPRPRIPGRVVWAAPRGVDSPVIANNRLYIVGYDKALYVSDDSGDTCSLRSGQTTYNFAFSSCFLRLVGGTLLTVDNSGASPRILRSTDDGANWTVVHTFRTNTYPLGPQSWAYDRNTGYLYYGEYSIDNTLAEIRIYRSTDAGVTWSNWYAFPGPTAAQPRARHIHGVQYDPIGQRVYFSVGDDTFDLTGIYRVTADGSTVEPVITNTMLDTRPTADMHWQARAIGMMFFPTHIAWGVDSDPDNFGYSNGIYRMPRSAIGTAGAANSVERVLSPTKGPCWWTVCAADDYSKWLVATDFEGAFDEKATNIYIVEDNGARVSDGGSLPMEASLNTVAPLGAAELHGKYFWLSTFNMGAGKRQKVWRGTLTRSSRRLETTHEPIPMPVWREQNSGYVSLAAGESKTFGGTRSPQTNKTLYLFDIGARRLSGTGTLTVQVVRIDTGGVILSTTVDSFRTSGNEDIPWITATNGVAGVTAPIPVNTRVEFRIVETGGAASADGYAMVTYGWGP